MATLPAPFFARKLVLFFVEFHHQLRIEREPSQVGSGVYFFQLPDAHLRVNLGRFKFRMPKHLLDKAEVRAVLQHGVAGVPEQVATVRPADPGLVHVIAHELCQPVRLKNKPHVGQEHRLIVRREDQLWLSYFQVPPHPAKRPFAHRDQAVPFPFALAQEARRALQGSSVNYIYGVSPYFLTS